MACFDGLSALFSSLLLRAAVVAALALQLPACDGSPARAAAEAVEREEDGVRIVEHGRIGALDGNSVSFERRPSVRIGGEGPSEAIGSIAGFRRRPDGTVLVADGMASELRLYDARGQFVRLVGRQGRGPGEYNSLSGVFSYAADSVLVADAVGSRFSILTPDLEFVRAGQVPRPGGPATGPFVSHTLLDVFADGSLLVGDLMDACFDARQGGFCADSITFYRMGQDGSSLARFGTFMVSRTERAVVRRSVMVGFAEPHAQGMWAVHGDRFYYADGQRFAVQVFSGDGQLTQIVRVQYAAPSYSRLREGPHAVDLEPIQVPTKRFVRGS
jgi:hypothetical protein